MNGVFVPFLELMNNPAQSSDTWIQSIARLASNPYYSRLQGGPKYILDLETQGDSRIRITLWEEVPAWLRSAYSVTSPDLLSTISATAEPHLHLRRLFRAGEEVFFQGYAKYSNGVLWINVPNILIADPSTVIGPREIIGAMFCPRAYYLSYVKNIADSILKKPNRSITRGNIVHAITEKLISSGDITRLFRIPKSERNAQIRDLVETETNTTFRLDAALHEIAQTPLESVQKDSYFHLKDLLDDTEVLHLFEGKKIGIERQINQLYGITGTVDIEIENNIPVELKTSPIIDNNQIVQLKVYILASYLESGNREGYLLLTRKTCMRGSDEERHIHPVVLTDADIQTIIQARHKALVLRRGLALPTTLDHDCTGCRYAEPPYHRLHEVYPPCQFYCQTERYWECFETVAGAITTRCSLFDTCPMKLVYFDPNVIDHFNKLRSAVLAENQELTFLSRQIRVLPPETLETCGQRVDALTFREKTDRNCIFDKSGALPYLDLVPGDRILMGTVDNRYRYRGTLIDSCIDAVTIRFDGIPNEAFFSALQYYLTKDYSEKRLLRYLLKALDYTQRNKRGSISFSPSRKSMHEKRVFKPYNAQRVAQDLQGKKIVAIQTPCQTAVAGRCAEILEALPRSSTKLVVLKNSLEIEDFIRQYPKKHDILILDREDRFPANPRVCEIKETNTPKEIAEKISLSPIIVTEASFLHSSHVFELLKRPDRSIFFDYTVVTGAEQLFEPLFLYLKNFGYHLLLIGDAFRVSHPVRNRDARTLGLSNGPFGRLILYESYFESDDYSVYFEPFKVLPQRVVETLQKGEIDIHTVRTDGSILFKEVEGSESVHAHVKIQNSIRMGDTSTKYRLIVEAYQPLDSSSIDEVLAKIQRDHIDRYTQNQSFRVGDVQFRVLEKNPIGKTPESGENVHIVIHIPIQFCETLQELLFSNEEEITAIIDMLRAMDEGERKETVVLTPFISQASRILSALYNEKMADIPVYLPLQISGKSFKNVIVSLVTANSSRILRYPLTDPKTLYTMLTCAEKSLVIVGRKEMIEQSRILFEILLSEEVVLQ